MSRHIVIAECIDCTRSWQAHDRYGDSGYEDAIRILEAMREGIEPVPALGDVEYVDSNTSAILYKLIGFLRWVKNVPQADIDAVTRSLDALVNHSGDIMYVIYAADSE